jgi:hypothetical protein
MTSRPSARRAHSCQRGRAKNTRRNEKTIRLRREQLKDWVEQASYDVVASITCQKAIKCSSWSPSPARHERRALAYLEKRRIAMIAYIADSGLQELNDMPFAVTNLLPDVWASETTPPPVLRTDIFQGPSWIHNAVSTLRDLSQRNSLINQSWAVTLLMVHCWTMCGSGCFEALAQRSTAIRSSARPPLIPQELLFT